MQGKNGVTYRLKKRTEELLTDEQKRIFLKLLSKIPNMLEEETEDAIWQFTYWLEKANVEYGFYGNELTYEQANCLRRELIQYYKQINPCWMFDQMFLNEPYDKIKSILMLRSKVKYDRAIVYQVVAKVERYVRKNHNTPKRIVQVASKLRSKYEKNRFTGLLKLGFMYEEAVFLKPYAKVIGIVFKEMFEKWTEISKA